MNVKRNQIIEKGRKLQQISSDVYFLNKQITDLQKQILETIHKFQQFKNKNMQQREIILRLQFLNKTLNGTLRFLKQNKINQNMINQNNLE